VSTTEPTASTSPHESEASSVPSLDPVISGNWTGLRWVAGPVAPQPSATPTPTGKYSDDTWTSASLFGWSHGYLLFRSRSEELANTEPTSASLSIHVETSPDGLRWTKGQALDVAGLEYWIGVTEVVEGPAGLLAVGRMIGIACGGPSTVAAIWTSSDGKSWTSVSVAKAFGHNTVYTIDAGSAGYIATGQSSDGAAQFVWVSSDGRTWRQSQLPTSVFGKVVTNGATAFAGGFVLAGAVLGDEGCGGPVKLTPSLWWSADAKTWSRDTLPGSTPGTDASMSVYRINDHAVVAEQWSYDETTETSVETAWISTDGKSWKLMDGSPMSLGQLVSDGERALMVQYAADESGRLDIWAYRNDLSLVKLAQTGDLPIDIFTNGWQVALGPTGLVATDYDGTRFFVGVPTGQ
jgi:hypothetical protein